MIQSTHNSPSIHIQTAKHDSIKDSDNPWDQPAIRNAVEQKLTSEQAYLTKLQADLDPNSVAGQDAKGYLTQITKDLNEMKFEDQNPNIVTDKTKEATYTDALQAIKGAESVFGTPPTLTESQVKTSRIAASKTLI